jgi:predicted RecB family nuclease
MAQEALFDTGYSGILDEFTVGGYFTKGCAHYVVNNENTTLDQTLKEEHTPSVLQRMAHGVEFEKQVFDILKCHRNAVLIQDAEEIVAPRVLEALGDIADTSRGYAKKYDAALKDLIPQAKLEQEAATLAAMDAGAYVILGGRLPRCGRRVGKPDVLVRYGTAPMANGLWAYIPVDVKHHNPLAGSAGTAEPRSWMVSEFTALRFEDAVSEFIGNGTPQLVDALQLAHYVKMLRSLERYPEGIEPLGGIIGNRRSVVMWHELSEAHYSYADPRDKTSIRRSAMDIEELEYEFRLEAIARVKLAASGQDVEQLTQAEHKADCKECQWRTVCKDDLKERDHVTLIPGVTPARAEKLVQVGVKKRADVARLDPRTASVVQAHSTMDLPKLIDKAKNLTPDTPVDVLFRKGRADSKSKSKPELLKDLGVETVGDLLTLDPHTASIGYLGGLVRYIDSARAEKVGKVLLARGVEALNLPRADVEVDVDMENDATVDPNSDSESSGLIYMWGTLTTSRHAGFTLPGKRYRDFSTFTADDAEGEARAFVEMWQWLQGLMMLCRVDGLTFRAYCYSAAEARCMRSIASRHAGFPGMPSLEEVEAFLVSEHWVDLYKVVSEQLVWPTEDLGLKSTAKWARHSWRDDDANGASSTVWYLNATKGATEEIRTASAARLREYNEDDVIATLKLRDWLDSLNSSRAADRLPRAESLDKRFKRRK